MHKCDFYTYSVIFTRKSVIETRTRVIYIRKVWFPHAECDFEVHEYSFETYEYGLNAHECDLYTHGIDFKTNRLGSVSQDHEFEPKDQHSKNYFKHIIIHIILRATGTKHVLSLSCFYCCFLISRVSNRHAVWQVLSIVD
jgi:hypothetical protein